MATCVVCGGARSEHSRGLCQACYRTQSPMIYNHNPFPRTATHPAVTLNEPCTHHWCIEAPNGPASLGRCSLCGEQREFANSIAQKFFVKRLTLKKGTA